MALGKLWNAFFGKSAAVEKGLPPASETQGSFQQPESSSPPVPVNLANAAAPRSVPVSAVSSPEPPADKVVTKVKRKAVAKG